jgi:nitrogen fixation protein FixH
MMERRDEGSSANLELARNMNNDWCGVTATNFVVNYTFNDISNNQRSRAALAIKLVYQNGTEH